MIPDVQGTYSLAPLAACAVAGRRLAMSPRACAFESQVHTDVLIHRRTQVQRAACLGWAASSLGGRSAPQGGLSRPSWCSDVSEGVAALGGLQLVVEG